MFCNFLALGWSAEYTGWPGVYAGPRADPTLSPEHGQEVCLPGGLRPVFGYGPRTSDRHGPQDQPQVGAISHTH